MQFIKKHFIGLTFSIIIFMFILLYAIVLFSPKHDLQKRGFVQCTDNIASDISQCGKGINFCLIKSVLKGTQCDINIIYTGLKDWIKNKQEYPWSNYYFEPELEVIEDNEDLRQFYEENPNIKYEMQRLRSIRNNV